MIYVDFVKEKIKEHNLNLSQIPDNLYRILIIEGSGSAKINSLFNPINHFFFFFIMQFYFAVPEDIRLNSTHYSVMKISNKQELKQIAPHYSSGTDFKNFMSL